LLLAGGDLAGCDNPYGRRVVVANTNKLNQEWIAALQYWCFDPTGCDFPRPSVPVLPAFPAGMPGLGRSEKFRSDFLETPCESYSLGRYALAAALRSLGVGPGKTVLIPAYHCRTMIDPVLRLGGNVVLFSLRPDLTPDWTDLDACMSKCGQATALLLPHYFGFPQPIEDVRGWCERHRVAYVEDCSHAMFGLYDGKPIGSFGDYAVASPYKFFASEDGGLLRCASHARASRPLPGMGEELKAVWHSLEKLTLRQRKRSSMSMEDMESPCWTDEITEEGISRQYNAESERIQALRWSRWTMKLSSIDRLSAARRRNYLAWLEAVSGLPGCHPLFECLPDSVVPYMFPLWLDNPESVFFRLKRARLPIFRWDELAVSNCQVSRSARLGLIHLPCHQGIGKSEMDWMVEVLRRSLRTQAGA
jgi:perosamine synthetase